VEERVFGQRYRVTEKLGSGGMADVFKAVDDVLGRTVALKVLHAHYATDPGFVARFRQEAQAAANLSHPNIVNIFDWGKEGDTYFIVMEYVRGIDLKALINEKGPAPADKAAEYASQVCAALSVAHGYDIVHRDIKPHNIVLTPDGSVKVMDFGIARAGNSTLTQTGSVLGTAHYVSPEQAQGRTVGPQSDLYSLGVVLYELTTGRVPFEGDSPVAVALKQVNDEPVPPRQINPDIPPSMEAVILRAMQKDPADRYASAEEMRRDLQRVASGRMVESPSDATTVMPAVAAAGRSSGRVRQVPQKRNPWPWIGVAALILAVTLGALWFFGFFGGTEGIVVPDLTGMTVEEATEALEAVELVVGESEQRFSEEETSTIISQSPEPAIEVEADTAVNIVLSKGAELFSVPDLINMTESEAIDAIRQAGFELDNISREFNKDVAEGNVITQDPAAGAMVKTGTAIAITVSKGTELRKVPDVVGKTQSEADAALKAEGFGVSVSEEFSTTVASGRVISQSPGGGVSVEVGTSVAIVVSKGEEIIKVPDVIGKLEAEAIQTLEDAGFSVLVNYQVSPDDGLVLTQDPFPDSDGRPGDKVTIWVGQTSGP